MCELHFRGNAGCTEPPARRIQDCTFLILLNGQTTTDIAYNATAATIQTDLEALSTIGTGNVEVSGGVGGPFLITFVGELADTFVPVFTWTNSGAVTAGVSITTNGASGAINLDYNLVLAGTGIIYTYPSALSTPIYPLINQAGALESLSGINTISGNIQLNGAVGIGVEQIYQNSTGVITGTSGTAGTTPITINTNSTTGMALGDTVKIAGTGVIDGSYTVSAFTSNSFTLSGTTYSAADASITSGTWNDVTEPATEPNYTRNTDLAISQLTLTGVQSNFGAVTGGIIKLGSQRLIVEGPGNYTGNVDIRSGVLLDQNNTGLGVGYQQLVTVPTATSGTFTLTLGGLTTTITYSAIAATLKNNIQTGLAALGDVAGAGNVSVTSLGGGVFQVEFIGQQLGVFFPTMIATTSLLGTTSSVTVTSVDSTTTVETGAALELGNTIATMNGGIAAGLQVQNVHLILNGSGNTTFNDPAPLVLLSHNDPVYGPIKDTIIAAQYDWTGPISLNTAFTATFSPGIGAYTGTVTGATMAASGTVSAGITTNGSPIVITTGSSTANLYAGESVTLSGTGNAAANGTSTITAVTGGAGGGTFTLNALGNGSAITGGNWTESGPIVITTTSTAGLSSGETVTVSGVNGNTNANGTFTITVIDNTHFALVGSSGISAYTSGGAWALDSPSQPIMTSTGTITGASNTGPIVITTTTSTANLIAGETVTISGVTGNTAANGTWTISSITGGAGGGTFTLNGTTGNGAYISGGTWTLPWVNLVTTTAGGTSTYAFQTAGQTFPTVETISFASTIAAGSTFTLTFGGQTTAPISWNNNAATLQASIQSALAALSNVGTGNVTVAPVGGQINFQSPLTGQAEDGLILSGNVDDSVDPFVDGSGFTTTGSGGTVTLSGNNTYRGTTTIAPNFVYTVASNTALGGTGELDTQTVSFTGASQTLAVGDQFTLTFNGPTTQAITYSGNAATDAAAIENALDLLSTIGGADVGGSVSVVANLADTVFTIAFGGNLAGFDHQSLLSGSIISGTNMGNTPSVAVVQDGAGAVIVQNGASLQLQGQVTIAGKSLLVQGQGIDTSPNAPQQWFAVGPAPITDGNTAGSQDTTGRINTIAVDPSNAQTIYIGTAGGGAWKTTNGGLTWQPLFDGIPEVQQVTLTNAGPGNTQYTLSVGDLTGAISGTNGTIGMTPMTIDTSSTLGMAVGDQVVISGTGGLIDGTYAVTAVTATSFAVSLSPGTYTAADVNIISGTWADVTEPAPTGTVAGTSSLFGTGTAIVIDTSSTTGLETGDWVTVTGVGGITGNTGALGTFQVTLLSATSFYLDNTNSLGTFAGDVGNWSITTAPITFTNTSADIINIQDALDALPAIGGVGGSVTVTQSGTGVFTVTFSGGTLAGMSVPVLTGTILNTGPGSIASAITTNAVGASVALFTGSIVIDSSNPQHIFLGTGDTNNSLDSYYGTGVYQSFNSGQSWTLVTGNQVTLTGATGNIIQTTGNGTTITVTTQDNTANGYASTAGLVNGDTVVIAGATDPLADGTYVVSNINENVGTFQLVGSTGGTSATYVAGGTWTVNVPSQANPLDGKGISSMVYDPANNYLYVADGDGGTGANEIQTLTFNGFHTNPAATQFQVTLNDNTISDTTPPITWAPTGGGSGNVKSATGLNSSPIVITTNAGQAAGLVTGDMVTITNVNGENAANGTFTITYIDNSHFSLNGTLGTGTYLNGGNWIVLDTNDAAQIQTQLNLLANVVSDTGFISVTAVETWNAGHHGGNWSSPQFQIQFEGNMSQNAYPLLSVPDLPEVGFGVFPPDWSVTENQKGGPLTVVNGTGGEPGVWRIAPPIANAPLVSLAPWVNLTDIVSTNRSSTRSTNPADPFNAPPGGNTVGNITGDTLDATTGLVVIQTTTSVASLYNGESVIITGAGAGVDGGWIITYINLAANTFELAGTNAGEVNPTPAGQTWVVVAPGKFTSAPGPDDDYRVSFPQNDATWTSLALEGGTLYAALGTASGSVNNGVFYDKNPNTANPLTNTIWYAGDPNYQGPPPYPLATTPFPFGVDNESPEEFPVGIFNPASPLYGNIKITATADTLPPGLFGTVGSGGLVYNNEPTLYASVSTPTGVLKYVLVSPNAGVDWFILGQSYTLYDLANSTISTTFSYGTQPPNYMNAAGGQTKGGNYANAIFVNPTNAQQLFVAGEVNSLTTEAGQIYGSTDGGQTWTDLSVDANGNGPHTAIHAIAGVGGGPFYFGGDGGIWKLSAADLWTDVNGNLETSQINSVATPVNAPAGSSVILAGTQMNGVDLYSGDLAWTNLYNALGGAGLQGGQVLFDPENPNNAYVILNNNTGVWGRCTWPATAAAPGLSLQSRTGL